MKKRIVFNMGELFCGPGGLGFAASTAKLETESEIYEINHVWATDCDIDACRTYINNICPDSPRSVIPEDIRKLDMNRLKEISPIDALVFGFPCNDFSVVGKQKGIDGSFGPLYRYGIHALNLFKPKWFLAENVGGLKSANQGDAFKVILKEMIDEGYTIKPYKYKFEKYGVPQARHRIIIVGIRNDLEHVEFKVPSPEPYKNIDVSAKNAIDNPPIEQDTLHHTHTRHSKNVVERLKYIRPGENAFTADMPEYLKLNVRGAKISQIYRRLHPDLPSYTITGSGGGGTHVYHWEENRSLTNRERARLQTFPDTYHFSGSKESIRKQIGLAVQVQGARVIFESILKSFANIPYPAIEDDSIIKIEDYLNDI